MDIKAWLKKNKVAADEYDADDLLEGFLNEMEKGLNGDESSSLAMIPAYVGIGEEVPAGGKSVAVIDAGGTNLRIGIAHFDENGKIHHSHDFGTQRMPGSDREYSASEFYAVLADTLEPHAGEFDDIGFCFSYPAKIQPNLDGRLLHWTKEIKIPELVDTDIGKGLLDVLADKGKRIVVLNDTVATLLAGRAEGRTFNASSYIGFILGTGTNTAYVEHNKNIKKLGDDLDEDKEGSQVINVESGGFDAFDRGPFDLELDRSSGNRGKHVFEKMISGAYLGPLTLKLLKALAVENEHGFSRGGAEALSKIDELSTIHISKLAAGEGNDDENDRTAVLLRSDAFNDTDRDIMKMVFAAVVERAAFLTAINIAAAVVKSGEGQNPKQPVCVNIDGSTYYNAHQLEEKVQSYLKKILDARGLHIRCIKVENAPVVGAAIAGLTAFP